MQSGGPPASTAASSGPATPTPPSQSVGSVTPKPGGNIIRPVQQTSYHVPRGAAAVASIAMPRPSSLATIRAGPGGSLVSIRGSSRPPNPGPQQVRPRPASSSAARPITPQRSDTPRPPLNVGAEKSFGKSPIQLQGRSTPLVGQGRVASASALSVQTGQPVQIVTQAVTQSVTLATSQPASQSSAQNPLQIVTPTVHTSPASLSQSGAQTTLSNVSSTAGGKPRPLAQAAQTGTITTLPTNPPAVVLATPARLTSPGLIGVQTGPTRLALATAIPASGARIVSPSGRMPQGRTVTYTSSHQMLQTARLPPAPVRLGPAGRGLGMVSLQPVLGVAGVAPLKPAPAPVSVAAGPQPQPAGPGQATSQAATQTSTLVSAPSAQPQAVTSTLPSLQPAPLRALPSGGAGGPGGAQPKVMASTVVTVAAVAGAPLRSVVAAAAAGPTQASTLTIAPTAATAQAAVAATKPGTTLPQTLTTVAARPVAVAGQAVRPAPGQPSVYIQTAPHRASPGPAGERSGSFPIQSAFFYEATPGSFQVANVPGRTYSAGGPPYIVQTARPVGAAPQQVHGLAGAAGSATPSAAGAAGAAGATSTASGATSSAPAATAAVVSTISTVATAAGQPPRFNSIMVLDPSRTALPIHAVVPAEGGATGTTYIAADGSLLPVQALPVAVTSAQGAAAASGATPASAAAASQESGPQMVTQVASVVSQAVTSSSGHLPVQIQMVPAPVHIQTVAQLANPISSAAPHGGHPSLATSLAGHPTTPTATAVPVPMSLGVPHQVLSHPVTISHSSASSQPQVSISLQPVPATAGPPAGTPVSTPTTPSKPNASPRPSILRKRDNEGSPLKAQKNLTPLLQSMGPSNPPSSVAVALAVSHASTVHAVNPNPPSPPSPPKRPDSSGPQSSGSTTISATSSPGQESPPPGATGQPPPSAASITAGLHAAGLAGLGSLAGLGTEMSPRKKPRKQQLTGNELQEHKTSEEEMEFMAENDGDDFPLNQQPQEPQQLHQQVLQQQQQQQQQQAALPPPPSAPREFTLKRPNISLLSTYRYSWKSRNNHFLRHSDVKPKDERRPSVNELASQRHIHQRLDGWKVHHLTAQMEDLADVESQVCKQLETMLGMMERKAEQEEDKDVTRVSELIKGNMQRSRVIADQLLEAKTTVMKIFEHKPHVKDIITRCSGKRERIFKKREKS